MCPGDATAQHTVVHVLLVHVESYLHSSGQGQLNVHVVLMKTIRQGTDDEGWIPGASLKVLMRSGCKCEAECVRVRERVCLRAGLCAAR